MLDTLEEDDAKDYAKDESSDVRDEEVGKFVWWVWRVVRKEVEGPASGSPGKEKFLNISDHPGVSGIRILKPKKMAYFCIIK